MKKSILFVDDDKRVLSGFFRNFNRDEFELYGAENGVEALSILNKTKIDVIVSDQFMPGMSGVELLEAVRTSFPKTVRIMVSGRPNFATLAAAINQGEIYRYFTKPCCVGELRSGILEGLEEFS